MEQEVTVIVPTNMEEKYINNCIISINIFCSYKEADCIFETIGLIFMHLVRWLEQLTRLDLIDTEKLMPKTSTICNSKIGGVAA